MVAVADFVLPPTKGSVISVREEQPENAPLLMEVTEPPMVILVSSVQFWKVLAGIEVPLLMITVRSLAFGIEAKARLGAVTVVRLVQPLNALLPTEVTVLGMVKAVIPEQPENA